MLAKVKRHRKAVEGVYATQDGRHIIACYDSNVDLKFNCA